MDHPESVLPLQKIEGLGPLSVLQSPLLRASSSTDDRAFVHSLSERHSPIALLLLN